MASVISASLLAGAVHGGLLAAVLWRRTRHRRASRYLAGLLIALSAVLIEGFLDASGVLASHPQLIGSAAALPFLLGPLLFLYVRAMTAPEPDRLPRAWPHFLLFAGYVALVTATFYVRTGAEKQQFMAALLAGHEPWYVTVTETAKFAQGVIYVLAALRLLRAHRPNVQSLYSNLDDVSLRWLLVLVILNAAVWATALALFLVRLGGRLGELGAMAPAIVALGSAVVVFFIGYFQLQQAEIFAGQPRPEPPLAEHAQIVAAAAEPVAPDAAAPATAAAPYQRARLAAADADELEARLRAAMTQARLYQRPGLTLSMLAETVAATPHELSQLLSTRLDRNFYGFINEHRVAHVKAALLDPARGDAAVLDLAFEAGFSSKSTFNAAFRRATGVTPREFRQRPSAAGDTSNRTE